MSDLRLKDPSLIPSGGWRALQPETGFIVRAPSKKDLARKVKEYRQANGLPIENNFIRQLGNQICLAMSDEERETRCRWLEEDDEKNPKELQAWSTGRQDLKKFANAVKVTLAAHATGEPVHVPPNEAAERAVVCAQCPRNVPIAPCFGCGELGALYRGLVGTLETPSDPRLESCSACGCGLKVKVHLSTGVLEDIAKGNGETAETYPNWCWMREIL